jgi:glycosyltransferase involved in cell wall biosynthesis
MIVSIVIPVHNEEAHIVGCLDSLLRCRTEQLQLEVVVVDNNSTDRTVLTVQEHFGLCPQVTMVSSSARTIAGVRMDGYRRTSGEIVGFLDGDCLVPLDWLSKGIEILTAQDGISCVGFAASPPGMASSWVEKTWHAMSGGSRWRGRLQVPWLASFNLLLNRSFFEQVGGFDCTLETCEDSDLGYRLSAISSLVFSDETTVRHLGDVTTLREFFQKERWRGKSNLRLFLSSPRKRDQVKSALAPPCYLAACALLLVTLMILTLTGEGAPAFAATCAACLGLPVLLAVRARVKGLGLFAQTVFLYAIYLLARGLAIVES